MLLHCTAVSGLVNGICLRAWARAFEKSCTKNHVMLKLLILLKHDVRIGYLREITVMTIAKKGVLGVCFGLFLVVCFPGCSGPEKEVQKEYIIKTGFVTLSSTDFSEELDLKKAAYPYTIKNNPQEYNQMVIHLVKTLTEEMVLLSAAVDQGVVISDEELESAVTEFKADYPEDSFEQIFLKNAISYPFWRQRFHKQLVMEKLIDQQLRRKIEITPQDIIAFYQKYQERHARDLEKNESALNKIKDEKELVSRLRMHKTQEKYSEWIQELGKDYPVDINKEKLKSFLIGTEINKDVKHEN